jgi:hypothetical protein
MTNTGEETNALSKDRLVEWIKNDNDLEAFVVGAVVEVSGTVEKFGLKAIADAVRGSDVQTARDSLSQLAGAALDVSGTVQKRVRREGECKLVIEPGASVPGFVVFADCRADAETIISRKIRKGSLVSVRGKFQTFGAKAVCLSDCRLR